MSVRATVMGKARPLPIKMPTTLPPGPTIGPPRLAGRSSARRVSWASLRLSTTAGVAVRRLTTLGLASRTTGSSTCRATGSPKARGLPSLLARTIAIPRSASIPIRRTAWEPPVLSTRRRLALPLTTLAAVRKSPCGSMRNAVAKEWSLTIVITPWRSRSSSSGSSTAEGGAVGLGVGTGVGSGRAVLSHWPALGSRTAMPTNTRVMTRAASAWSSRLLGRRVTMIQRRKAALSWARPVSDTFLAMRLRNTETGAVQPLEAQGHAYQREGHVYFRVGSVTDYGRLSRLSREEMITLSAQHGADPNDPRKQDPLDFVLWQASGPDEPRWESPWGEGRPGWHIECSAMALEHIGEQVDLHGGGADLIFPHHESEIAQSESVTGVRPFARIWAHVGMLRYQGEKMSKSLRNLVLVGDLLRRYDADSIRVLLLRHHYREPWEYTPDQLEDAAAWTQRLRQAARGPGGARGGSLRAIRAALDDDLDTPRALRVLEDAVSGGDAGWRTAAELLGLRLQA